jgi:hypothetical protein
MSLAEAVVRAPGDFTPLTGTYALDWLPCKSPRRFHASWCPWGHDHCSTLRSWAVFMRPAAQLRDFLQ